MQDYCILVGTHNREEDLIKITKLLLANEIKFQGINIIEPTLEDIFLRFTERR